MYIASQWPDNTQSERQLLDEIWTKHVKQR